MYISTVRTFLISKILRWGKKWIFSRKYNIIPFYTQSMLFPICYVPLFFGPGFNFFVLFPSLHVPYIDPLWCLGLDFSYTRNMPSFLLHMFKDSYASMPGSNTPSFVNSWLPNKKDLLFLWTIGHFAFSDETTVCILWWGYVYSISPLQCTFLWDPDCNSNIFARLPQCFPPVSTAEPCNFLHIINSLKICIIWVTNQSTFSHFSLSFIMTKWRLIVPKHFATTQPRIEV